MQRSSAKLSSYPEFAGTLLGFDDYVSTSLLFSFFATESVRLTLGSDMVLEDVTELYVFYHAENQTNTSFAADSACSDYSGSNMKLPKILLNGNNICMVMSMYLPVAFRADPLLADSRRRRS